MRGVYPREAVHEAARAAVTHWEEAFKRKKEAWIADTAQRTYRRWFKTRVIGRELAETCFSHLGFGEDLPVYRAWCGFDWMEFQNAAIARDLAALTSRVEPRFVHLSAKEMRAIQGQFRSAKADQAIDEILGELEDEA